MRPCALFSASSAFFYLLISFIEILIYSFVVTFTCDSRANLDAHRMKFNPRRINKKLLSKHGVKIKILQQYLLYESGINS